MTVLKKSVLAKEDVVADRLKVSSPREIYNFMKKKNPPVTARDFYHTGRLCLKIALFEEAIKNFEKCRSMDKRLKKKCLEKITEVHRLKKNHEKALGLWQKGKKAEAIKNWKSALKTYIEIEEKYPGFFRIDEVKARKKVVLEKVAESLR